MALRPKKQIGTMACLCCGERIPVRQAENGTLNVSCSWCEFPAYAKPGTDAHGHIMKKTDLLVVEEVISKPPVAPKPLTDEQKRERNLKANEQLNAAIAKSRNSIFGV